MASCVVVVAGCGCFFFWWWLVVGGLFVGEMGKHAGLRGVVGPWVTHGGEMTTTTERTEERLAKPQLSDGE